MKYIRSRVTHREELDDLVRDPRERISLAHSSREESAHARRILDDHRKKALEFRAALELTREEPIDLDAEILERLRSLGYVQ